MKAMLLNRICSLDVENSPLQKVDIPIPQPSNDEILIKVKVCGVCHTEIDEIEGRTAPPALPVVPGHQVVGVVEKVGKNVEKDVIGKRVGVAWINSACGKCKLCISGKENLCSEFRATGRDVNGGYEEYMVVKREFAYEIPDPLSDIEAAPLLCAGAIGYRSLMLTGIENGQRLGLTGFGASGHLVLKMARYLYPQTDIYVFARSEKERRFALELGAVWAGDIKETPFEKIDCIIDTTPVWMPVIESLKKLSPGGRLVINAIRKEDIDKNALISIDYPVHLWLEKEIKSVANVTRKDVEEFLKLAAEINIKPEVNTFELEEANDVLLKIKKGNIRGANVLVIS
ncbi:MAG: alcohol dehydrogenase [Candidatus Schekmanbacteria bacterium]|nr:MAG: alcohol dehydrogenase [Candidatus Schekmanbacteria bacterium]